MEPKDHDNMIISSQELITNDYDLILNINIVIRYGFYTYPQGHKS